MNYLCRRIPNNWHQCSTLQVVEPNFPFFRCELHIVSSFQKAALERGEGSNFTGDKPDKQDLSQVIKTKINNDKSCNNMPPGKKYFTPVVFLSKPHDLILRENDQIPLMNNHQNVQSVLLKDSSKPRKVWEIVTTKKSVRRHDD